MVCLETDQEAFDKLKRCLRDGERICCSDVLWLVEIRRCDFINAVKSHYPHVNATVTNSQWSIINWLVCTRPEYEEMVLASKTLMHITRGGKIPATPPDHVSTLMFPEIILEPVRPTIPTPGCGWKYKAWK